MATDLVKSLYVAAYHARKRTERNSLWKIDESGIVHISMARGLEAVINICDIEKARGYTWTPRFSHRRKEDGFIAYYAQARVPGSETNESIFLHNLIMEPLEGMGVDHKDRDGLNCTRDNLRYCTASQNSANRLHVPKVRPYRGVYKDLSCVSWVAKVMVDGKYIFKCGFPTAKEAAQGYNELASEHHGEFATLNIIEE